jgi:hypothetical protein
MQATEAAPAAASLQDHDAWGYLDGLEGLDEPDLELSTGHMTRERPTRLLVPAAGQPLPETWGLTSVFDLAYLPVPAANACPARPTLAAPAGARIPLQDLVHTVITREPGITRCQRQHYSETLAWQEQERARRARQRPPRPPRKAKTMGKQLAELVAGLQQVPALP